MKNKIDTLELVMARGLPGSGKSTLLKRLCKETEDGGRYAIYVDMDMFPKMTYEKALSEAWQIAYYKKHKDDYAWNYQYDDTLMFLDTLCATNENIADVIMAVAARFFETQQIQKYKVTVYDFNEDRDACTLNNKIRAKVNPNRDASSTIKHMAYPEISADAITAITAEKLATTKNYWLKDANCSVSVTVKPAKVWDRSTASDIEGIKADLNTVASMGGGDVKDGKLYGEGWITGGREWNYKGHEWAVGGENPNDFDELDNVLDILAPNLTYLQYKKIRKECCSINEYHESDYYESYDKAQWVCDLDKLAEMLNYFISQNDTVNFVDKACNWLAKNASRYVNGEYNWHHKEYEYNGSVDTQRLINDFKKEMED